MVFSRQWKMATKFNNTVIKLVYTFHHMTANDPLPVNPSVSDNAANAMAALGVGWGLNPCKMSLSPHS